MGRGRSPARKEGKNNEDHESSVAIVARGNMGFTTASAAGTELYPKMLQLEETVLEIRGDSGGGIGLHDPVLIEVERVSPSFASLGRATTNREGGGEPNVSSTAESSAANLRMTAAKDPKGGNTMLLLLRTFSPSNRSCFKGKILR